MADEPTGADGANGASRAGTGDQVSQKFDPKTLDRTVVAGELLEALGSQTPAALFDVIIDLNLEFPDGRELARARVERWLNQRFEVQSTQNGEPRANGAGGAGVSPPGAFGEAIDSAKTQFSQQYIFARLSPTTIRDLVEAAKRQPTGTATASEQNGATRALSEKGKSPIYKIWLDHDLTAFMNVSICTVKADAARAAFGADGKDIIWAVADSGIDATHRHFELHENLKKLPLPLRHRDFTGGGSRSDAEMEKAALSDIFGHGTHVAGIIAGEMHSPDKKPGRSKAATVVGGPIPNAENGEILAFYREQDDSENVNTRVATLSRISGMAPRSKLLSLKVLDDNGAGKASNLIAAIEYIQHLNGNGRRIRVHGLNISVGYSFKPEWFACGQSPLCVEIDRLVRSGVCVVVAAGNDGYGFVRTQTQTGTPAGLGITIADPGNADLAITVGSTHREAPHTYGVSYFSSKGPTGDGRLKPDLLAPGEKIISCMSSQMPPEKMKLDRSVIENALAGTTKKITCYREDSGTSMAAPHVSGVAAAFLSNRREFIGRPEVVKTLFLSSASDLKRAPYFQGKGLVDLMRAIQSV
jgi:subtilisin family serine protease